MKQGVKQAAAAAAVVVGVLLLVLALIFGVGMIRKATADFRGDVAATERVHANGAYRITAYEQFFDRCAAIQAKEATIRNLEEERKVARDEGRVAQIDMTLTAVKSARANDIARYNADSAKTDTEANFKASNLPYRINENMENTTCA